MEELSGAPARAEVRGTILIVEDEIWIRLVIADELMRAGFPVIQCGSGDEAWQVLQSSAHIDLLMTDIRMPGHIDGLELAARVRASWPHIRTVIVSAEALKPPTGDAFLSKPFDSQALLNCVQELLAFPKAKS